MGLKESEMVNQIIENIEDIRHTCNLPPITKLFREKSIAPGMKVGNAVPWDRKKFGAKRIDVLLLHDSDEMTIIEAKTRIDTHDSIIGIAQLLLYETLVNHLFPSEKINKILITPLITYGTCLMIKRYGLDVKSLEWKHPYVQGLWLEDGGLFDKKDQKEENQETNHK